MKLKNGSYQIDIQIIEEKDKINNKENAHLCMKRFKIE